MPTQPTTPEYIVEGLEASLRVLREERAALFARAGVIDKQVGALTQALGTFTESHRTVSGDPAKQAELPGRPKGKKMSVAARKALSVRMKQIHAERKAKLTEKYERETAPAKPKRTLSAAGRKAIVEATKARWARIKAERKPKTMSAGG